jgi:hypothetical protein
MVNGQGCMMDDGIVIWKYRMSWQAKNVRKKFFCVDIETFKRSQTRRMTHLDEKK